MEGVRRASDFPVLVGSGVTPENVSQYQAANGFIVGTWLKRDGAVENPVDPQRVHLLRQALGKLAT